jgi:23S rRNA pseudouridine1911/1915/1917 synthase
MISAVKGGPRMRTITILYEDNHLLGVLKPAQIPVQSDASGDPDLLSMLKEQLKIKYQKAGKVFLGMVHRLDRPVGGVMVFAKTSKAARRLSEQIRENRFEKVYLAVSKGIPSNSQGIMEDYLYKDEKFNRTTVVSSHHSQSKLARLSYEVLKTAGGMALFRILLITGRSHQIRVQLAHAGCPIVGDIKYGIKTGLSPADPALWSHQLAFLHPIKQEKITLKADPPAVFPWNSFSA